ncbi:MAG: 30S ribosomal protein S6 [Bacteroidota bacterium]
MRPYELMVIFDPGKVEGDEAVAQMLDRIQGIITGEGGQVSKVDRWGRRRLAYEIGGTTEGYYVVIQFEAEPKTAAELGRVLRITDGVLRHMIVRPNPVTRRARIAQATRRQNAVTGGNAGAQAGAAAETPGEVPREQVEADGRAEAGDVAGVVEADGAAEAQPVAEETAERA